MLLLRALVPLVGGALCTLSTSEAAPSDILLSLERDVQGLVSPFLSGRKGSFYLGGQSTAADNPLTSLWPVKENETIGFTHPYFRDGRARGIGITCDEITGCGHSLHDWEFYRDTQVLYGTVVVGTGPSNRTYVNPTARTMLWRPDRLTARYELEPGVTIQEVKFFTNDDVLLDIVTLLDVVAPMPAAASSSGGTVLRTVGNPHGVGPSVAVHFSGASYVNAKPISPVSQDPSSKGLAPETQRSVKRNATVVVDTLFPTTGCGAGRGAADTGGGASQCSAVRVDEKGTAYAKPLDCAFKGLPEGMDCLLKEGKMMYDGMAVFLAASQDISSTVSLGRDADRRATYNFTIGLSTGAPTVMGWVMGDDTDEARTRIAKYMNPAAAAAALLARTASANEFLTTKIPQLNVTLKPSAQQKTSRRAARAHTRDTSAGAGNGADTWDVHTSATSAHKDTKLQFLKNVAGIAACEAACDAQTGCVQWNFANTAQWCALYGTATEALNNPKFTTGCKGSCPSRPGPSPHPPKPGPPPSPPPPMNRTLDFNNAYYFGWAMYWMMLLESDAEFGGNLGHAQSAPNNFLGIHLHDTQYYLKVGAWVAPDLHSRYAHGNVLMWHKAAHSPWYTNKSTGYWATRSARGLMPDNMGGGWIASSTCDQVVESVEGAWVIHTKAPNITYLATAYDLFRTMLTANDGNITSVHAQRLSWRGGKQMSALIILAKMATALGKDDDAKQWLQLLGYTAPWFQQQWGQCGERLGCNDGITTYSDAMAPAPYFKDEWAARQSKAFLMDDVTGHYPPNASYGGILLAFALNASSVVAGTSGPWVAHTTYTYEAIEGLFRHNVDADAIHLTTEHVRDMQRTYGWTIFPEAWSKLGGPWGDQWYNWGSPVAVNLVLERLAGVDYTAVGRAEGAGADGTLTVRDFLPADWHRADVSIPYLGNQGTRITVEAINATAKRINVMGNTLGALALQPSIGQGGTFKSASPAGYTKEASGERVSWLFVGEAAKEASVVVVWD